MKTSLIHQLVRSSLLALISLSLSSCLVSRDKANEPCPCSEGFLCIEDRCRPEASPCDPGKVYVSDFRDYRPTCYVDCTSDAAACTGRQVCTSTDNTVGTRICILEDPDASCEDGVKNQGEDAIDCGGPCASCEVATCSDHARNGDETGVDCGGSCPPCDPNASCSDGVKNQGEDETDCGGPCDACDACTGDGLMRCGGCVNTHTNVDHCGECDKVCDGVCAEGECVRAVALEAGGDHTCAILSSNRLMCWGANARGQLGRQGGDGAPELVPEPVDVRHVAVGFEHTCALLPNATVSCFGSNTSGQLGSGIYGAGASSDVPVSVAALANVTSLAAGFDHTCAMTPANSGGANRVLCWGDNTLGQRGDSSTPTDDDFVSVTPTEAISSDVIAIAAGWQASCATTNSGQVVCWGDNRSSQLEGAGEMPGDYSAVPVAQRDLQGGSASVTSVGYRVIAVTDNASAQAWGANNKGQLGRGVTSESESTPSSPVDIDEISSIRLGFGEHACALTPAKQLYCWGANNKGQLGIGTSGQGSAIARPTRVMGAFDELAVEVVAPGSSHTCAIDANGAIWCWGSNALGQVNSIQAASVFDAPQRVSLAR